MAESHIIDESGHSLITETQERMLVFDFYITCTVGMILSIIILSSFINMNKRLKNHGNSSMSDSKYYKLAIICGIVSVVSTISVCVIRFFSTDLIAPINLGNNVNAATALDSMFMIFWIIEKIAFAFGFTYIYLSLFQKDSIDNVLKITMGLFAVCTIVYGLYYLIAVDITASLDEIYVGAKRGIYAASIVDNEASPPVIITCTIGMIVDLVFIVFLIYRFNSRGNGSNARKATVLLCIVESIMIIMFGANLMNLDIKFMVDSLTTVVDTVCLFLMFNDNQELYNNFCGCICCGIGSKYAPIQEQEINVDDDQQDDDGNNQQLLV